MTNLIGISGRIGSGKDTVGKIIQYIHGEFTCEFDPEGQYEWGGGDKPWRTKKFAWPLKRIASILTGIPVEKFEDQEFKKTYLGDEWDIPTEEYYSDGTLATIDNKPITVRKFLQVLGTDCIRDNLHTNAWINATFADYKIERYIYNGALDAFRYPNWIFTDMRFPNEMEAITNRGGKTIRVIREGLNKPSYATLEQFHPSETALDDAEFDYVIYNNGTLTDLIGTVRGVLAEWEIIPA